MEYINPRAGELHIKCSACAGAGRFMDFNKMVTIKCTNCDGTGLVPIKDQIDKETR